MKWCVQFPEEEILVKRPCLRKACLGNRSAATLLSFLLYRASIHQAFQHSKYNQPGTSPESTHRRTMQPAQPAANPEAIGITLTQQDIVTLLDYEISDRTLRDMAIPLLLALDYLDVESTANATCYLVHLTKIQAGIDHPPTKAELLLRCQHLSEDKAFSNTQRQFFRRFTEKVPFVGGSISDEERKKLQSASEKTPLRSGNTSVSINRCQSAPSQASESLSSNDKSKKSTKEKEKILEERVQYPELQKFTTTEVAAASLLSSSPQNNFSQDQQSRAAIAPVNTTTRRIPAEQQLSSTEAVLHFVEEARGQRFSEPERQQQAQAATFLLNLQPSFSFQEIQEAWQHGSDTYWKQHYDQHGMTLTDLVRYNKHGTRRITAILEHKRRQQDMHQTRQIHQTTQIQRQASTSMRARNIHIQEKEDTQATLQTKQEADQLVQRIQQDSQTHKLPLTAMCTYEHDRWVVQVQVGRHRLAIHTLSEWQRMLPDIQEVIQVTSTATAAETAGKDI